MKAWLRQRCEPAAAGGGSFRGEGEQLPGRGRSSGRGRGRSGPGEGEAAAASTARLTHSLQAEKYCLLKIDFLNGILSAFQRGFRRPSLFCFGC